MPRPTPCRVAWSLAVLVASASGCADAVAPAAVPCSGPCVDASTLFDASTAGAITGQVVWIGGVPAAKPFPHRLNVIVDDAAKEARLRSNPFVPHVDEATRGIQDAVITLRGVDMRRARQWDHPGVRIEFSDLDLRVRQGARVDHMGFVRRGAGIEVVSCESRFHGLQANGAEWFSLSLPDPNKPLIRMLDRAGVVELTSGAGYAWMRAFLLVADHPYMTRTDDRGRFTLDQVPPGRYEVVCWMPGWEEIDHDRDPEMGFVTRVRYTPGATVSQTVDLSAKQRCDAQLVVGMDAFSSQGVGQ